MSMQVEKMTNELFSKREEISGMLLGREEKVREVKNGEVFFKLREVKNG